MLLKTIEFDEKNIYWTNSKDYNCMFLRQMENHIKDVLSNRGYIYLNQICEILGDDWDPDIVNQCLRCNEFIKDKVWFEYSWFDDNSCFVYIMHND